MYSSLNRTIIGLKCDWIGKRWTCVNSLNRTIIGLKGLKIRPSHHFCNEFESYYPRTEMDYSQKYSGESIDVEIPDEYENDI